MSLLSNLLADNSSMLHTLVDSFFDAKKAAVKDRLRQSMESIVDELFVDMVLQVKEMLLPPKEGGKKKQMLSSTAAGNSVNSKVKPDPFSMSKPSAFPPTPMAASKPMKPQNMVFSAKSKPEFIPTPKQPFIAQKRSYEAEDDMQLKKMKIETASNDDDPNQGDLGSNFYSIESDSMNNVAEEVEEVQGNILPLTTESTSTTVKNVPGSKPFACSYTDCTYESNRRRDTIRHILAVHLKKNNKLGQDENEEPPDPLKYLISRK